MRVRGARLVPVLAMLATPAHAQQPTRGDSTSRPVVRAVLFFSPTCPHCRDLIITGLPPITARFGDGLAIVGVNASTEGGQLLYEAVVRRFSVGRERQGVPTMVVGSRVLVGSDEIAAELPGLVERGLAAGGVDWPVVAELRQALIARGLARGPAPAADTGVAPGAAGERAGADERAEAAPFRAQAALPETARGEVPPQRAHGAASDSAPRVAGSAARRSASVPDRAPSPPAVAPAVVAPDTGTLVLRADAGAPAAPVTVGRRFLADPVANSASVVVLLGMLAGVVVALATVRDARVRLPRAPRWVVPALALLGIGVAGYLSYIELTGTSALCGPVGDCNTVQQSAHARLLGVPVGVLGMGGYLAIMAVWAAGARRRATERESAWVVIWGMALFATLFSGYLTFLEPFVIGATCAWCLSSAVIVTLILMAATPRAARALGGRRDAAA